MLPGGNVVAAGRVHHDDPSFAGRIDVDIFEADPRAADDFQVLGRFDQFRRDFRPTADHPAVVVGADFLEFIRLEANPDIHLESARALEYFQTLWSQRVTDQNLHS